MGKRFARTNKLVVCVTAVPALFMAAVAGSAPASAGYAGASCDNTQGKTAFFECVLDFYDSACRPHPGFKIKWDKANGIVECAWYDASPAPGLFDVSAKPPATQDSDKPTTGGAAERPQRSGGEAGDQSAGDGSRPAE